MQEAVHEILEAHWNFVKLPAQLRRDAIDHAAADHRLAHRRIFAPLGSIGKEVMDANRQIVIGRQQPAALCHDSMPVMVCIAGEGDIKFILQGDQGLHRVLGRWIHANPAIPVEGHEAERRIDNIIHNFKIQTIALGNRFPVMHAGPAKRIDAQV